MAQDPDVWLAWEASWSLFYCISHNEDKKISRKYSSVPETQLLVLKNFPGQRQLCHSDSGAGTSLGAASTSLAFLPKAENSANYYTES